MISPPCYRPFHKTLPRSSAFVKWISVKFYETGCIKEFIIYKRLGLVKREVGRGWGSQAFHYINIFILYKKNDGKHTLKALPLAPIPTIRTWCILIYFRKNAIFLVSWSKFSTTILVHSKMIIFAIAVKLVHTYNIRT